MIQCMAPAKDLFQENKSLKALLHEKDQHIALLEEKLRLALHKRFGASSEKAAVDPRSARSSWGAKLGYSPTHRLELMRQRASTA